MEIQKTTIIQQIRKAIDDIAPETADSFKADTDEELWQAVQHAVMGLLMELPMELLEPTKGTNLPYVGEIDGRGTVTLPEDFLRFISFKLNTWLGPVYNLIEEGSDDEKRQRSTWSRGTPEKPVAMLDHKGLDSSGKDMMTLRYWTAGKKSDGTYDHTVNYLLYIPMPTVTDSMITCAMKKAAEPSVIYRAAALFFEGKKEPETAEKFRNI